MHPSGKARIISVGVEIFIHQSYNSILLVYDEDGNVLLFQEFHAVVKVEPRFEVFVIVLVLPAWRQTSHREHGQ